MSAATTITPSSTLRRRAELTEQDVDDALIVRNSVTGEFYGLESIALRIWQLLGQPRTVAELCAELQRGYDIGSDTCQRDVLEFLEDLHGEGLVETCT